MFLLGCFPLLRKVGWLEFDKRIQERVMDSGKIRVDGRNQTRVGSPVAKQGRALAIGCLLYTSRCV